MAPGHHVGSWTSYEALPPGLATKVDGLLLEARTAGASVGRVHLAWSDLEPRPGDFDLRLLESGLAALDQQGMVGHVLIETIDSDGYSLPADLMAPGTYALANGRRLDDPVILDRFGALLDQIAPTLRAHHVFAIAIGNEPDSYFDDAPPASAEGLQWSASMAAFTRAARTRLQAAVPGLAVGMALNFGAIDEGFAAGVQPIVDAGDVLTLNYYCQDTAFQVRPATSVPGQLDAIVALAGDRPVVFQELGCPAGIAASVLGASPSAQAAFFHAVFAEMDTRPQLRAAFAFQVVDWSPTLAAQFANAYRAAGFPALADAVQESLASMGLVEYATGQPRGAWAELLAAAARFR